MATTKGNVNASAGTLTPKTDSQITTGGGTTTSGYTPTTVTGGAVAGAARTPTYQTIIQQPDYTTTQFITNAVYQNLMGQNASKAEVDKYHQMFTEYAKTHPVQTSTTSYDVTGTPVRSISAQRSPLSETDFISNIVAQGSDAKEYKAATTYFDAMRTAMGSFRGGY
jgi:hypothetical protein